MLVSFKKGSHLLFSLLLAFAFVLITASPSSAKSKRDHLNVKAFEFARQVGLMETRRIMGDLYISSDCHRIWDGKTPFGDQVIKKNGRAVAITMSKDICDDWADDLVELFKSYGYQSSSDIFKAPGFKEYVWKSPEAKAVHKQASAIHSTNYQGDAFGGLLKGTRVKAKKMPTSKFCFWMPISQQQYFPDFEVLTRLGKVENWYHKSKPKETRVIMHKGVAIPLEDKTPKCKPVPVR